MGKRNNAQIYSDITKVLVFWMNKKWVDNIPKIWRHNIYGKCLEYVLEMLSASCDAYNFTRYKEENIRRIISNLYKIKFITRQFFENHILDCRKMNNLDEIYEKIEEQARKWLNNVNKTINNLSE